MCKEQSLIDALLDVLDQGLPVGQHPNHRDISVYVGKRVATTPRTLINQTGATTMQISKITRRLISCGVMIRRSRGCIKHFELLADGTIDRERVRRAIQLIRIEREYNELADEFNAFYGAKL